MREAQSLHTTLTSSFIIHQDMNQSRQDLGGSQRPSNPAPPLPAYVCNMVVVADFTLPVFAGSVLFSEDHPFRSFPDAYP